MKRRLPAWAVLAIALTACSKGGTSEGVEPVTEAGSKGVEEPAALELTEMLVLRSASGLEQGDTVRVDVGNISDANQVTVYNGETPAGTVPFDALGPSGEGTMMVNADQMNVRRCRSTGCTVVGQVSRGQHVRVHDLQGRWYRYNGSDGTEGYLRVDYLVLPAALKGKLQVEMRAKTAEYYDKELKDLRFEGEALFDGFDIKSSDDQLQIEFYTPFKDGPAVAEICNAMRGISGFVLEMMAQAPSEFFPAYSAGVYHNSPDTPASDDLMVAGQAGGAGVYCMPSN